MTIVLWQRMCVCSSCVLNLCERLVLKVTVKLIWWKTPQDSQRSDVTLSNRSYLVYSQSWGEKIEKSYILIRKDCTKLEIKEEWFLKRLVTLKINQITCTGVVGKMP